MLTSSWDELPWRSDLGTLVHLRDVVAMASGMTLHSLTLEKQEQDLSFLFHNNTNRNGPVSITKERRTLLICVEQI